MGVSSLKTPHASDKEGHPRGSSAILVLLGRVSLRIRRWIPPPDSQTGERFGYRSRLRPLHFEAGREGYPTAGRVAALPPPLIARPLLIHPFGGRSPVAWSSRLPLPVAERTRGTGESNDAAEPLTAVSQLGGSGEQHALSRERCLRWLPPRSPAAPRKREACAPAKGVASPRSSIGA